MSYHNSYVSLYVGYMSNRLDTTSNSCNSQWLDICKFGFRQTLMTNMFFGLILKINTFHFKPGQPQRGNNLESNRDTYFL